MGWNPGQHSDDDNLRWSWLRAVEWGRWPVFLSQPIGPVLLIWLPWQQVALLVIGATLIGLRFYIREIER